MRRMDVNGWTVHPLGRVARACAGLLLASGAMAAVFGAMAVRAQDAKPVGMLPAPAPGKAIVCIFRTYRFTGSAAHDEIFVNDKHLGKLLSDEYEFTEVDPGTVVISGLPKMYYGGIVQSAGAALAEARKQENERARFQAEPGKVYFFKWTSGTMATDIKVTPVDQSVGEKAIRKLHPSKPPEDPVPPPAGAPAPQ